MNSSFAAAGVTAAAGASPFVLATTLSAAVAHASWNSIAHHVKDKLVSFTLLGLGGMICAVPLVLLGATPSSRAWGYLGVSVVLHIVYTVLLMASYRLGDFSQTYPLARGTSPLVVLALAAAFAGETPGPGQFAGVALICAGLGSLALSGRRSGGYDKRAVVAAIATGLSIASYTTVDGLGVRLSHSVAGYAGWLMLLETAPWPFVAVARRRRQLLPAMRPVWPIGLLGGGLSVLAYGLVLWAQTRGALATVAALRESSIVVAAVIGSVAFHERFGWVRIVAALSVTAGIAVLYLA